MTKMMRVREYCNWVRRLDSINARALEMDIKERMWSAYKAGNSIFTDEEALRREFEEWYKTQ